MHRFVTISISHYCEKVRWALDWAGEPYVESAHLPLLHWASSFGAGAGRTVPVLVADDGEVLGDSTDILRWLDRRQPELGLYGDTAEKRQEIEALEDLFDEKLGPATRRWGYYHLLPHKELTLAYASQWVPSSEVWALRASFPLVRALLRRGLGIDAAGAARSKERIDAVMQQVSQLLADGRPFLAGERISAADLTFAALASPLLQPPEHPLPFPPLPQLPEVMRRDVELARATPAGEFGLRLYRERGQVHPLSPLRLSRHPRAHAVPQT
jgi:glutathione S-transferase